MEQKQFDELVKTSFESLPEVFRAACKGVVVRSADFADDDVLASLDIRNPYDLLGLYQGVNLARKSVLDLPNMPDMVLIYRLPIIEYAEKNALDLEDVVAHVIVHEIGHHMGFSDDDMTAIEFARDEALFNEYDRKE